ncbi:AraC-like DNA-binding protein [Rhodanobacter sp. ANJX3]|jgi:AraC-like DNA-binding protein|uniref:helix-turn-helix transcriptional regulator n=1 Tax=unclassified Rhodanobacter TaxID=2621553 RepID=UPI0015CC4265|nr:MULTISPECIES: helix-turn-helix transcriptional regulator [unclassified Rhodanobacter]MBB5357455.1 AraC-like DNA-binding protein [Rhodanobacter sp. ANJX3]NYE27504.1 AraC-like DNA-binding protein [Rhodanobacter sp. K2T2]
MSLVLYVSDQRIVGGRLMKSDLEPTCEAMVSARLQTLAARLSLESSPSSAIGDHVQKAARVLEFALRKKRPAEECVLSAKILRIAKEILSSELSRPIHMPEVANACGISEGHLRRAFRTCTGVSPRQWRQERRLQFCRKELVETNRPLAHISREAGFVVQSHFSRVFIQSTGMSPSEWRRVFQSASKAGNAAFVK